MATESHKPPSKSPPESPPKSASRPADERLQADPDPESLASDVDSVFDANSIISSTASISSTILNYRKLHGRTYQNYEGAEYWGPNDDRQNKGLDMAHHMMYLAFEDKLYLAPLENPQKVLDVGTGTGIWAIDFADEHPSAEVIGTDLSPIQPAWVPPNCKFELDNCEQPWTYAENSFDYIHIRGLVGCVQDWEALYRQCLRCLKPGGWLEQHEFALPIAGNDAPLPDDCVWHDWGSVFREAGRKMGRSFEVTDHWEEWLRKAGFTETLHTKSTRLPIGGWPRDPRWKEVGLFNQLSLEQGLEGFATYICTQVLGWRHEEVTVLLAKVREAIGNPTYHAYYPL
ncbi:e2fe2a48-64e9-499f-9da9-cc145a7e7db2 [Thermothielavioides terrestris]|nr:e2fe2a48-64e9-499f-9da9-cc145a7e7db2 [Thermothielavioides terrestris]